MAEQARETLAKPFQTTAKVRYQGMETTMTTRQHPILGKLIRRVITRHPMQPDTARRCNSRFMPLRKCGR